jgi:fatty-acyl-CoA synthase
MIHGPMQYGVINDATSERFGSNTAIVQGDKRVTFGELGARTRQLARVFLSHGLGCHGDVTKLEPWESCQDHVAVLSMNRPEFLEAYLGAYKARAAPFNVNYRYTPAEIRSLLEDADATAVVYEGCFGPQLAEALQGLPAMQLILRIEDGSGAEPTPGSLDYEGAIADASSEPLDLPYSGDDAFLLYTGGTTGTPKAVIWPQAELYLLQLTGQYPGEPRPQTIPDLMDWIDAYASPTFMVCPPLMHGGGLWSALITFHQGGTVLLSPTVETFDAHTVLETIERERATQMMIIGDAMAVPLVAAMRERSYDLSSLFVITSGAVTLTPKLRKELLELVPHALLVDSYGGSETGWSGTRLSTADASDLDEPAKFENVNETAIFDETKQRILDPSEVGHIGWLARPGRLPRGYYKDPEKTKETFVTFEGRRYCITGDRASYRDDGQVHFLGREAVCINTGGEKVYAEEIETALKEHPSIRDAIVLGTPDDRFGERVTAVLSATDDISDEELDKHCRATIAGYKVPRAYVRVDSVPRLENGKPDYAAAKAIALSSLVAD